MPSETRKITFTRDELIDAIVEFNKAGNKKFNAETIDSLEISDGPHVSVDITFTPPDGNLKEKLALNVEFLGKALIYFCMNHHIPVPRESTRALAVIDNKLVLCFYIDQLCTESVDKLPDFFDYDFFG